MTTKDIKSKFITTKIAAKWAQTTVQVPKKLKTQDRGKLISFQVTWKWSKKIYVQTKLKIAWVLSTAMEETKKAKFLMELIKIWR